MSKCSVPLKYKNQIKFRRASDCFCAEILKICTYVLTPKFIGEAVKLNPIWIIFALSVGGSLFGILGILEGQNIF